LLAFFISLFSLLSPFSPLYCIFALLGAVQALERQKEFSDAIRNERDELRDEVVQLKDILKVLICVLCSPSKHPQ